MASGGAQRGGLLADQTFPGLAYTREPTVEGSRDRAFGVSPIGFACAPICCTREAPQRNQPAGLASADSQSPHLSPPRGTAKGNRAELSNCFCVSSLSVAGR
jgi:hypothetical protein